MTYVDAYVLAVPTNKRQDYERLARKSVEMFMEWGAIRHVECWSDDVPHGKMTDFFRAVQAKDDESVVFSWVEYPSKEVRDAASKKMLEDPRMKAMAEEMSYVDGRRMILGGFDVISDQSKRG